MTVAKCARQKTTEPPSRSRTPCNETLPGNAAKSRIIPHSTRITSQSRRVAVSAIERSQPRSPALSPRPGHLSERQHQRRLSLSTSLSSGHHRWKLLQRRQSFLRGLLKRVSLRNSHMGPRFKAWTILVSVDVRSSRFTPAWCCWPTPCC